MANTTYFPWFTWPQRSVEIKHEQQLFNSRICVIQPSALSPVSPLEVMVAKLRLQCRTFSRLLLHIYIYFSFPIITLTYTVGSSVIRFWSLGGNREKFWTQHWPFIIQTKTRVRTVLQSTFTIYLQSSVWPRKSDSHSLGFWSLPAPERRICLFGC